jgi:hypothetical protein
MTFYDLPDDWAQRPLTDAQLVSDVLDLVVSERDRRVGCYGVLACDADGRLIQPMVVPFETPDDASDLIHRIVAIVIEALGDDLAGRIIIAIGRRDGLSVTEEDRQRCAELRAALEHTSWSFGGVHLITLGGSRLVAA